MTNVTMRKKTTRSNYGNAILYKSNETNEMGFCAISLSTIFQLQPLNQ